MIDVPEGMSPTELATALKVRPVTVRQWIARGHLRAFKVGGRWRVTHGEVERFVTDGVSGKDESAAAMTAGKTEAA